MAGFKQQIFASLLVLVLLQHQWVVAEEAKEEVEELVQEESKDGKLEIIKRIKKVNEDGSYTIGYEADDGSFKIESRDVLGNIKGTYGYVDDEGQIKRVSYSTSNASEIVAKPEVSVVQRIPKLNRTLTSTTSTTRRPISLASTTTNNVIQSIARRRASSTTTPRPSHLSESKSSKPNHIIYTSAAPRVLLQGRSSSITSSTTAPSLQTQKSESEQLARPEVSTTVRPTELPYFKRKFSTEKPVTETSEEDEEKPKVRSNILRRELAEDRNPNYNIQEHVYAIQQSAGGDVPDVYSSSMTTGTPRPLFTTTPRPRLLSLSSTTAAPILISRPTVKYPPNYQRNVLEDVETSTADYTQESSTPTEATTVKTVTSTGVPIVQIPANRPTPEPLVAIRHPFQRGAILVPLSSLQQNRVIPVENLREANEAQQYNQYNNNHQYGSSSSQNQLGPVNQYDQSNQYGSSTHFRQADQYIRETTPKPPQAVEPRPIYVRRLPPPPLRPIPVHVDENGYIRELPQQVPTPYPIPVPISPIPKYVNNEIENDIDHIEPPVSTRDFQKLLQQLILRQSKLEKISALTNSRRDYTQESRTLYQPYYVQPKPRQGPVQFVAAEDTQRSRQYLPVQNQQVVRPQALQQNVYSPEQYSNPQSYAPTRRVARLLQRPNEVQDNNNQEYLPPDVREMLLLRMLQLAINPALPVEEDDEMMEATTATTAPQYRKVPVRNVEILGEEEEQQKRKMVI